MTDDNRRELPYGSNSMFWPDPHAGPWQIEADWADINGRLECIGLSFRKGWARSEDPKTGQRTDRPFAELVDGGALPSAVQAAEMRMPIDTIVNQLRAEYGWWPAALRSVPDASAETLTLADELEQRLGGRSGRYGTEHWRQVADIYLAAWRSGSSTPTKAVREHFHVSTSTAGKWVAKARAQGLLPTAPGQGRPGGNPSNPTKGGSSE
jgi:hypothetical protein